MANNTINKEEIEKFNSLAEEWWDPDGKFKPLHKFNPIRIEYIKNNIIKKFNIKNKKKTIFKFGNIGHWMWWRFVNRAHPSAWRKINRHRRFGKKYQYC